LKPFIAATMPTIRSETSRIRPTYSTVPWAPLTFQRGDDRAGPARGGRVHPSAQRVEHLRLLSSSIDEADAPSDGRTNPDPSAPDLSLKAWAASSLA
jgi:hypothetical protein